MEINFFDSGFRLTEYLLKKKHSSIVYFGNKSSSRFNGYQKAMKTYGCMNHIQIWNHPAASRSDEGRNAMDAYLKQFGTPPQAVIAVNDLAAIGIISSLKKHGFRVPEDCAVAGFDNIAIGEFIDPPLTTIGFDNGLFADTVWDLMIRRLNKTETGPVKRIELKQELIIRESC